MATLQRVTSLIRIRPGNSCRVLSCCVLETQTQIRQEIDLCTWNPNTNMTRRKQNDMKVHDTEVHEKSTKRKNKKIIYIL